MLASDRARFALKEMNHALLPAVTVTRGVDILGRRRVAWLAVTSDDLTPEEAGALAARMARRAPIAVAVTKRLLNEQAGSHYRAAENLMPAIFGTEDVAEGRRAFEERREPRFQGR